MRPRKIATLAAFAGAGGDVMSSWNITGAAPGSQVPTGSWG
ncbi:hypothetical protein [Nocardia sp. NPDC004711]